MAKANRTPRDRASEAREERYTTRFRKYGPNARGA